MSLATLRQQIADVLATDAPATPALPTGIATLDAALGGGLPRGRLSELLGTPGSGVTALARRVVARALAEGAWVAVVDATRTLAPRDWHAAEAYAAQVAATSRDGTTPGGLWVVRPPDPARGAWCADVLLRSGAFGLVVLDGAPPLPRAVALRLVQLAREADAALVVAGTGRRASDLGGAVRLRVESAARDAARDGARGHVAPRAASHGARDARDAVGRAMEPWGGRAAQGARRSVITVEKGGTHRTVEVNGVVGVARRLCAHPEVPDRRDVARTGARGRTGDAATAARAAAGHVAPNAERDAVERDDARDGERDARRVDAAPAPVRRARRCAEPRYGGVS